MWKPLGLLWNVGTLRITFTSEQTPEFWLPVDLQTVSDSCPNWNHLPSQGKQAMKGRPSSPENVLLSQQGKRKWAQKTERLFSQAYLGQRTRPHPEVGLHSALSAPHPRKPSRSAGICLTHPNLEGKDMEIRIPKGNQPKSSKSSCTCSSCLKASPFPTASGERSSLVCV